MVMFEIRGEDHGRSTTVLSINIDQIMINTVGPFANARNLPAKITYIKWSYTNKLILYL